MAVDQNICNTWNPDSVNALNKASTWFAKGDAAYRREKQVWPKMFPKMSWQPNSGDNVTAVIVEDSPILRQTTYPSQLSGTPLVDTVDAKERTSTAKAYRHRFVSKPVSVIPAFQDFIRDKISPLRASLTRTMAIFEEQFYRTRIWQKAPQVYVCGQGLIDGNAQTTEPSASTGKNDAWVTGTLVPAVKAAQDAGTSALTFNQLHKAFGLFTDTIGGTPYTGSELQPGMSKALSDRYVLVTDRGNWTSFQSDPWLLENRPLNMNIVNDGFFGDFFGHISTLLEHFGLRIKVDSMSAPTTVTYPAPEKYEDTAGHINLNRRRPDPDYTTNAQIRVSWLVGGSSYKILPVGGSPNPWNSKGHDWNGRIEVTDNILVQCTDSGSTTHMEANSWKEYVRLQSEATYAMIGLNHFNILPIVHTAPVYGLPTAA